MAYNNFSKSYGGQGGDEGGGYLTGSQQGSQGQGGRKNYSDESLRPVTIKQLNDWVEAFPGAEMTIDNAPITQVTIVGQVRTVNPQTTNITYRLDDGTSSIDVKSWVDPEKPEESRPKYALDQYVRALGHVRTFNGKKSLNALFMRPIADYNEVNYHLLKTTYVHLFLTKGPPGEQRAGGGAGGGDDGESMFVDGYGGGGAGGGPSKLMSCSRMAQTMYNFLQNTPGGNEGLHINMVSSGTGLSLRDVFTAANELLREDLIYTTVDEETWAVLESY